MARVPAGRCVYAVGDVHGWASKLDALHEMILADAATSAAAEKLIVYLGDYVDRGPDSRGVIDRLLHPLPGFQALHLCGNHEALMLDYIQRGENGPVWACNGGDATLESYDLPSALIPTPDGAARCREAVPAAHLAFLDGLPRLHREGDYLFVHAGIRPGVPLDVQRDEDLIWIREAFLDNDDDFGVVVVHGHTPRREIQQRPNRIGIDTHAYATGVLTCVALEGEERRFLQTEGWR